MTFIQLMAVEEDWQNVKASENDEEGKHRNGKELEKEKAPTPWTIVKGEFIQSPDKDERSGDSQ